MKKTLLKTAYALLALALSAGAAPAEPMLPSYELSVAFEPGGNLLVGEATIELPRGRRWDIEAGGLKVVSASLDGRPIEPGGLRGLEGGVLRIRYEGVFPYEGGGYDVQNIGAAPSAVVYDGGISLLQGWYPTLGGMALYRLRAAVPEGFVAVSEAEEVAVAEVSGGREYSFAFPHPVEGISLVAGRYGVHADAEGDTEVYAYFFDEDSSLAGRYVEYARKYLRMYEEMLGPYPYKRFSVVENFLPTGYSMPTFTLLGSDVVRLPFIAETSLGHEVVHQWFGNSVYADTSEGNWHEGLSTYLADHRYEELEGRGAQYRKKMLADYQSYVPGDGGTALGDFTGRVDRATGAVGYGKGAMVFHMLRERLGQEAFMRALRRFVEDNTFRSASWSDLRKAFEEASQSDLGWFFSQWLERTGVPRLEVENPRVTYVKGQPTVSFTLKQLGAPYRLNVKYRVVTASGTHDTAVETTGESVQVQAQVQGTPLELVLDPEYDVMRSLLQAEWPPTVSRLVGDETRIIVPPEEGGAKYGRLIRLYLDEGFSVKLPKEITDEEIGSSSLLLLGTEGPVQRRLFGEVPLLNDRGFSLEVRTNPLNPSKVVAIAYAASAEEVWPAARKVFRYGKYSYLRFEGGRNIVKATDDSDTGIRAGLAHTVVGLRPQNALSFEEVISEVMDKPIIYVGESHTNYEDHRVQLEIIRSLHDSGRKVAVGMEMFQRRFQEALDDYIGGRTTEKEFLKASEYFKRWKFDYRLYREIIDYARAHDIPVLALNTDSAIIKKVARGGLDALTEEERQRIPRDMDMADFAYRRRLTEVFALHDRPGKKNFRNFYQSQILWDETMAHSLNDFLQRNPGHQVVVLAGIGHVIYGSGIPQRAYRLNGLDYAIIINSNIETIEEGMADYILFPDKIELPPAPRLGVVLDKADEGLLVRQVAEGGPAEKAGIRAKDILVSIDGVAVEDMGDVKIALLDRDDGETVTVRVLRKRFLGGKKEVELSVRLEALKNGGGKRRR